MKIVLFTFFVVVMTSCSKDTEPAQSSSYSSGGGTGCPTTSQCGCSGKNKSDCDAAYNCCKWVVGTGCVCR